MTRVVITRNRDHFKLHAIEHAGDKAVCAGVSAIAYALAGACKNRLNYLDELKLSDGEVIIEATGEGVGDFFFMAVIGLKQIELSHPDNLKVSYKFT